VVSESNIGETLSWSAFLYAGPRPPFFVLEDDRLGPIG
jgi:hypothetical protein